MNISTSLRTAFVAFLAAALVVLQPAAARADYALDAGDILEISVFGVADFTRRATVNIDGNVSVPVLGEVPARGRSITELREKIAHDLDEMQAFRGPHVTIELIEHRPFYISGDVSQPGAHPFRPGLTVRHDVALAGGFDALRYRAENPLLAAPEMQSRYESLWIDLVARQARVLSLQAELDGVADVDFDVLYEAPLPRRSIEELTALEKRELGLRLDDHRKEVAHLERAIAQAETAVESLQEFVTQQDDSLELQTAASERAIEQSARGITTSIRVEEERRALATLRGQYMDALARLTVARREHEVAQRQLDRAGDERQQRLVRELIDATAQLEQFRSQLKAAGERLIFIGALKSQLRSGDGGPEITIFRQTENGQERVPATEDTAMLPGDVLDVLIQPERLVITPGH
ncbi:MAG TPA: polysaccharide biosynthesis/export family protein [Saliniramus sp.]|nr:polysaccharide biosynthesis/export family protein [Saliniramus sp.]